MHHIRTFFIFLIILAVAYGINYNPIHNNTADSCKLTTKIKNPAPENYSELGQDKPYSNAWVVKLKDIPEYKEKKSIEIKTGIRFRNSLDNLKLVISIEENENKFYWKGISIDTLVYDTLWTDIFLTQNLQFEKFNEEAFLKVYFWNLSQGSFLTDTISVEFVQ